MIKQVEGEPNDDSFVPPWPSDKIRSSYTPCPEWDEFVRSRLLGYPLPQFRIRVNPRLAPVDPKPDKGIPRNVLREAVDLGPAVRNGKGDWTDKLLTEECNRCSFFVPAENSEPLHRPISLYRGKLPESYEGICFYGQRGRESVRKLLANPSDSLAPCAISPEKRQARLDQKKSNNSFLK